MPILHPSSIPRLPERMDDIIRKLLEKDRDLRHQTAADLCADLKRLKRDLELKRGIASDARRALNGRDAAPADMQPAHEAPRTGSLHHMRDFFRKMPLPRTRKAIAITAATTILATAIAAFFLLRTSNYVPCIRLKILRAALNPWTLNWSRLLSRGRFRSFPTSPSWTARNSATS